MRRLLSVPWRLGSIGIVLVHSTLLLGQVNSAARVDVIPRDADRRVDIVIDGTPFTSYIYPTTVKKPVLYPLRTADGVLVTRGFPLDPRSGERVDHPHHVGLWFNHSDVNGLDFWNNSYAIKAKDAPKMGTIVHRSITKVQSGRGEGVLEVTSDWMKPDGKPLLRETTRFVFHAGAALRGIDRLTTLTALDTTVTFHDNKDGMLGMRVRRELEQPADKPEVFTDASGRATDVPVLNNDGVTGRYRSSEGLEGDAVWSSRAKWTSLTGIVQGEPVAIVIFDHPTNYNFPTYWHARGYGLFAANPLGAKDFTKAQRVDDFTLAPGKSTTFRYRVVILNGPTTREQIEAQYTNWSR
jgi:methane monooxygenase PmoA-like